MKRMIILALTVLLIAAIFVTPAMAAEETYTVSIDIVASFSNAKTQTFVAYFQNVETGEMLNLPLDGNRKNEYFANRLPEGEYSLEKCVLQRNEEIEYEVVSKPENLIIKHDDYTFYTFRIAETSTNHGSDDWKKVETAMKLEEISAGLILPLIPMFLIWCVFAILGRRNYFKRAIAQLLKHLMFAMLGFIIGSLAAPSMSLPAAIPVLFCTCFPFGFGFLAMFTGKYVPAPTEQEIRDAALARDFRSPEANDMLAAAGWTALFLLAILCGVLGVILCPIVLIRDLVTVIKCRSLNFRCRFA